MVPAGVPASGDGPAPVAHQLAARELVGFAPGLDPLGADVKVEVAGELARVETGFGGEGVAGLGGQSSLLAGLRRAGRGGWALAVRR